jgi:prepilin-type N-terminal cleavage/methylation domain-containing protein
MKKAKGFTLVELVIVIIIVGVLSILSFPIYQNQARRAVVSEGKSLLNSIHTAQKIYYAEYGTFYSAGDVADGYNSVLDVDARANKYFPSYSITAGTDTFTATAAGIGRAQGIVLTLTSNSSDDPIISESGI